MSVAPTVTPGVLCCALSRAGGAARNPASAIAATPKYSLLLMLMCAFLVVVMRAPVANGRSGNRRRKPRPSALPTIQPQSWCIRNGSRQNVGKAVRKLARRPLPASVSGHVPVRPLPPPTTVTFCCGVVPDDRGSSAIPPAHLYGTRRPWRSLSAQTSQRGRQRRKNAHVRLQPGKHRFAAGRGRGRARFHSLRRVDHARLQRG